MATDKPVIVALDFPDAGAAMKLADKLDPALCRVKVGKELFTRAGPDLVRQLGTQGFDVFLDLKYHDIPNTIAGAVSAAADLGVWMVNVHASGSRAMMEAARKALPKNGKTLLIAVTVLTSMGQEDLAEINIKTTPDAQVMTLASLTRDCGLDGVVCSARETHELRKALGSDFILVTPGIRPAGDNVDDQKRIMTPAMAIASGSNYLVIGRPVTQAKDPTAKLRAIMDEINTA
jgi:orotidine-5'-phosphate decarboxylase